MADLCSRRMDGAVVVAGHSEQNVIDMVHQMCQTHAATALAVTLYKRRLSDGSGDELAMDKKIARRAAHLILSVNEGMWDSTKDEAQGFRPYVATLQWAVWLPETAETFAHAQVFAATWVMKENLTSRPVRKIVGRLETCIVSLTNLRQLAPSLA